MQGSLVKTGHTFFATPVLVVVVVLGALLLGVYFYSSSGEPAPYPELVPYAAPMNPTASRESAVEAGLGAEIFEKVSNPVKDALPDAIDPVVNPVEGLYRNPFE